MISYVNVHAVLDGRRNRAKASPSDSDLSQVLLLLYIWYYEEKRKIGGTKRREENAHGTFIIFVYKFECTCTFELFFYYLNWTAFLGAA